MDRVEFISTVALFQGLSDQEIDALNCAAVEKKYFSGQFIKKEFEESGTLYLLRKGRVKLTKSSYNGKEQTIQMYKPGEMIGLFALFTGVPFPANAVAIEDSVVLLFSRKNLEKTAKLAPSLMVNLFFALAMRMNECIRTVESLALKEIPQRLATYILVLLGNDKKPDVLQLPVNQKELSRVIGTTPETLSRVFARLAKAGILQIKGKNVHILDLKQLEDISSGC
ncbi:MAG: Crp/Fnr family transcriptional regulator [Spirochaetia bacterium]|nr:Crp/Fnr family transcriptional regulator [Spirochaetia bacterium]